MQTMNETHSVWQLTPEMQAALDDANARLAQLAQQHAPAMQDQTPPGLARDLVAWGRIKLKPEGAKLLANTMTSREFFDTLLAHDCLADARRVLSHSLPKRRALWWGVLAAYDALRSTESRELEQALKSVAQFVIAPTEDARRACGELAKRMRPSSMAACLVNAAFFSAGSVSPPGLPPVAPRPFITGRLVGVTVYLASVTRDPALYKQYLREYLRWGVKIASGELRWPDVTPVENSRLEGYWPERAISTKEVYA